MWTYPWASSLRIIGIALAFHKLHLRLVSIFTGNVSVSPEIVSVSQHFPGIVTLDFDVAPPFRKVISLFTEALPVPLSVTLGFDIVQLFAEAVCHFPGDVTLGLSVVQPFLEAVISFLQAVVLALKNVILVSETVSVVAKAICLFPGAITLVFNGA